MFRKTFAQINADRLRSEAYEANVLASQQAAEALERKLAEMTPEGQAAREQEILRLEKSILDIPEPIRQSFINYPQSSSAREYLENVRAIEKLEAGSKEFLNPTPPQASMSAVPSAIASSSSAAPAAIPAPPPAPPENFFSPLDERIRLGDLRKKLAESDAAVKYYQPKVDLGGTWPAHLQTAIQQSQSIANEIKGIESPLLELETKRQEEARKIAAETASKSREQQERERAAIRERERVRASLAPQLAQGMMNPAMMRPLQIQMPQAPGEQPFSGNQLLAMLMSNQGEEAKYVRIRPRQSSSDKVLRHFNPRMYDPQEYPEQEGDFA